jgi:hypothetical protein
MWVLAIVGAGVVAVYAGYRYTYPYGWSHCCSKVLGMELHSYADEHNGKFPAGQATPEASLSLLAKDDTNMLYILRGKTVPLLVTEKAYKRDGLLGPESCGWHYVEGLTEADNAEIAIVWDKVGLGHNGQRFKGGGHEVVWLDGSVSYIMSVEWPSFLKKQEKLLAARTEKQREGLPMLTVEIKMPDGQITNNYDGPYTLDEMNKGATDHSSGSERGGDFRFLKYDIYPENGTIDYTLTLPAARLRSKPVSVTVSNGVPSTNNITFVMERY